MAELDQLRKQIDELDESLLLLLNERGKLVKDIGSFKEKAGKPVFVPGRERALMQRLKAKNAGPLPNDAVADVFREVVHACRTLEKRFRVAYFGPAATFTHQAALRSFGRRAELQPQPTIGDVFTAVEKGEADYGVVPIENSTEGVVNHTLDMFIESSLSICSELELPISLYLLGRVKKGAKPFAGVQSVYYHYQALAQCRKWIVANLPTARLVETSSNAEAARSAAKTKGATAISSQLAAEIYGLDVLAPHIEESAHNVTRFLVIGTAEPQPSGSDKTSLMVSIKDRVGALYDLLLPFKKNGLNMTKIESRPTRLRPWEYMFFVDFLGHRSDPAARKALAELEESSTSVKVLGSYPFKE